MSDQQITCACGEIVNVADWSEHLNLADGRRHRDSTLGPFRPDVAGRPGQKEIQHRTEQAARALAMRGLAPQPQPLLTAFWDLAVRTLLVDKGIADAEELTYYLAWAQMTELENSVRASLGQNVGPKLIHLATSQKRQA